MTHHTFTSEDYPLISKDRSEKLALLLHLIANSNQPILVLGPKGVGKSKLFEILEERKKNTWHFLPIFADSQSTNEKLIEMISKKAEMEEGKFLPKPITQLDGHDKLLILIDNAGQLPPGELSLLIEHVLADPTLRLVLAMTPDEFFIKNRTDKIVDDCYIIELPTLTKKQCGDFLRVLVSQSKFRLPIHLISEHIIETVYQESQGIPGRIVDRLPQLGKAKKIDYAPWLLVATAFVLVAIALAMQWLSTH